eukprot:gene16507-22532_t
MDNYSSSHKQPEDYDVKKFKQMVAGHALALFTTSRNSGLLVLGKMGSGKSTTITIMLKGLYRYDYNSKSFILVSSPAYTPKTSAGVISTTTNIGYYPAPDDSNCIFVDTAGLDENRGPEEWLWTKSCQGVLFSTLQAVRAVLFVINYDQVFKESARNAGIEGLAKSIQSIAMSDELFFRSMKFIVTNCIDRGMVISVETVMNRAKLMLAECIKKMNDAIKFLNKKYPMTIPERIQVEANELLQNNDPQFEKWRFSLKEVVKDKDNGGEEKLKLLEVHQITYRLLSAVIEGEGKNIVLSNPIDEAACSVIRQEINSQIETTPIIEGVDLRKIKLTDRSFLFLNVLHCVVCSFKPSITSLEKAMSQLKKKLHAERETLDKIKSDWTDAREYLVEQKKTAISKLTAESKRQSDKVDYLSRSTDLVVHETTHIVAVRPFDVFNLNYLWGDNVAKKTYYYNGQSFVKCEYNGNYDFVNQINMNKRTGDATLYFQSKNGADLDCKVRIYVHQKDSPATKQIIEGLISDNNTKSKQISSLNSAIESLLAIGSQQSLMNFFVDEHGELKKQLLQIIADLDKRVDNESPVTELDSLVGLDSLFGVLAKSQSSPLYHKDLSKPVRDDIAEFREKVNAIRTMRQDECFKGILKEEDLKRLIEDKPVCLESDAPKPTKSTFVDKVFGKKMSATLEFNNKSVEQVFKYQFECGVCTIFFGLFLRSKPPPGLSWFGNLFSLLIVTAGLFAVLVYMRYLLEQATMIKMDKWMSLSQSSPNQSS